MSAVKVKTKRNSWFDTITSMFQNMKVGATTKKSKKSSPTSRLVHSKALNTAHRKLIRLRHAFQCQDAHCTKPSCPSTKKLLMHISTCKKKNCDVSDCIISRRLLIHTTTSTTHKHQHYRNSNWRCKIHFAGTNEISV